MEKLIVVGEKFTDFARRHQNVLTVNEFERFVWSGELAGVDKIVIGQGVQLDDISRTVCIIRQHYPDKIRQIVNLQDLYYQNNRDHQRLVHKRKKENILITSPEKRDEDSYCARLILQDASELLCDHQTGQHIQGMVLIEAARQNHHRHLGEISAGGGGRGDGREVLHAELAAGSFFQLCFPAAGDHCAECGVAQKLSPRPLYLRVFGRF
ncbi:A-factor biosynthesis repeat-containing protein [Klebsiella variicola]|nr:A-factor biosynthesis repeat-containing protein [Klebsiella variicola]